ncbi:hypothetical protein F2P81_000163 [Scophthalmus maximus]|uniref:Uncharacterized protein n=1 Tax=Scophthalmus maximus TaxID=52904 RepID=A0A6A4TSG8_SCOMX|nr:hypothetical protein F2P81_000163 [Scophthalmus maximus]
MNELASQVCAGEPMHHSGGGSSGPPHKSFSSSLFLCCLEQLKCSCSDVTISNGNDHIVNKRGEEEKTESPSLWIRLCNLLSSKTLINPSLTDRTNE